MNIQQLIDQTLEMEDFELEASIFEADGSDYGMGLHKFKIIGISDIGYSDKVIQLDLERLD